MSKRVSMYVISKPNERYIEVFEVEVLGLVNLIARSNGAEPSEGMKTA